jgi:DNA processing protein
MQLSPISPKETLYAMALTRMNYFNLAGLRSLYDAAGSATAIMENRKNIRDILPDAMPRLVEQLMQMDEPLRRAEVEMEYDASHGIVPIVMSDIRYPQRLRECGDAPLVLFYKGNADLNQQRVISIVGTRHCTIYGQDLVRRFIEGLRQLCPRVLVVSGLAYGVDIHAHRQALAKGYETVAVLAHGLDDLYPPRHRQTADEMVEKGGLLTEYFTMTQPDKVNFVRRNRIVAGMCDASILIESAAKGGGLITMRIAREYNRDTFAFPGAVGAPYSEGCNHLIRDNGAQLITSAQDFVDAMGWNDDATLMQAQQQGIERQIFPQLSAEEQVIVNMLRTQNDQQINMLTVRTNIPVGRLTSLLFGLEMKGVVRTMAGGTYHLIM